MRPECIAFFFSSRVWKHIHWNFFELIATHVDTQRTHAYKETKGVFFSDKVCIETTNRVFMNTRHTTLFLSKSICMRNNTQEPTVICLNKQNTFHTKKQLKTKHEGLMLKQSIFIWSFLHYTHLLLYLLAVYRNHYLINTNCIPWISDKQNTILFLGSLTSQQHASESQRWLCLDNCLKSWIVNKP